MKGPLLDDIAEPKDENWRESHEVETSQKLEDCSTGIRYPSDIWFLIAKHIPPECVCKFALICKDAYRVCLTVHFWKDLLKR